MKCITTLTAEKQKETSLKNTEHFEPGECFRDIDGVYGMIRKPTKTENVQAGQTPIIRLPSGECGFVDTDTSLFPVRCDIKITYDNDK